MTTAELEARLLAEGCNPDNYALNARSYDGFCMLKQGGQWTVFYSERGHDQPPVFTSPDDAACRYFFDFVMQTEHRHVVGLLRSEAAVSAGPASAAGGAGHRHARLPAAVCPTRLPLGHQRRGERHF
jgi:hypothetical protein